MRWVILIWWVGMYPGSYPQPYQSLAECEQARPRVVAFYAENLPTMHVSPCLRDDEWRTTEDGQFSPQWTLFQLADYGVKVGDVTVVGRYPSHYECEVGRIAALRSFPLWHPITDAELRQGTVVLSSGGRVNWVCRGPFTQTECPATAPRLTRREGAMTCGEGGN